VLYHEYETTVIIRPDIDDEATSDTVQKFQGIIAENDGHLLETDDWGTRRLAYTIQKHSKGHYVLFQHVSPASLVSEFERLIRIDDRVIRFMTVKLEHGVDLETKRATAEARRLAAEAARAEAEAKAAAEPQN
jgi:small subunit ribosomal protein S6